MSNLNEALSALQRIIVWARQEGYRGTDPKQIADLLDDAEYLVALLIRQDEAKFRQYLNGMTEKRQELAWIINEYNSQCGKELAAH